MKNNSHLLKFMTGEVISGIARLYGLSHQDMAIPLRCSRINVQYHMRNNSFAPYQKALILELFQSRGLEETELLFYHQLVSLKKEKQAV
ncbi:MULTISPECIES: hypothetical protein [Bacillus]|uniref:Transcriptional regulator n=1 Tax=Bacillus anthracis TaxID=1392 RepID=A0A0J1HUG4_BACAN|nr:MULTISPECIES: hypothetical protein [Bacillus]MRB24444.1 hypothetical protein [Bacillus thuringiensis]KLV17337.1 hypothetical protein ABW01_17210 [Bacillus anthracis]MCU4797665.1 hypothetical protein [Bacillus cereus]MCU5532894.1 hypothetical protein [Bacillus cereus]MDA1614715.1 hypothetical protein [Bacillus cereus]